MRGRGSEGLVRRLLGRGRRRRWLRPRLLLLLLSLWRVCKRVLWLWGWCLVGLRRRRRR